MNRRTSASINERLGERAAELAEALLGPPTSASAKELYFGDFTVTVRGHRAGAWVARWPNGSIRDTGDNLLGLIMFVNGCGPAAAFRYALRFLAQPAAPADGGGT
jgi:hypothetical protein